MAVKLGNGNWAVKEDKLLAYNDNSGLFFNKEFDFSRGTSATYVAKDGLIKTAGIQPNIVNNGDFSELGSELVTNGDFTDWTADNPDSWTVLNEDANNYVTQDGTYARIVSNDTASIQIKQTIFTIGKVYKVELDAVVNSGNVEGLKLNDATAAATIGYVNSTGHHTFYFRAAGTAFVINRKGGGDTDISIDNVSVKQVDPNDYWTLGSDWSVGDNKATYGANANGNALTQSNLFTVSGRYRVSFTISDIASGQGRIYMSNTSLSEVYLGLTYVNNQSYSFDFDATATNDLVIRGYTSGGGQSFSISNITVQQIETDTPRIDFTNDTKGHLLLEPSRTNIITNSSNFSAASWTTVSITRTSVNIPLPDGTTGGFQITQNGGASDRIQDALSLSSNNHFFSLFVKGTSYASDFIFRIRSLRGEDAKFNINTNNEISYNSGTSTNYFIEEYENGWYRVGFESTMSNTQSNYFQIYPDTETDSFGSIYIWGAQVEEGSYATSYIPTTSATSTRNKDVCRDSGSAQDFNDSEGVLYAEIAALDEIGGASKQFCISNSDRSSVVLFSFLNADNKIKVNLKSEGSIVASFQRDISPSITSFFKIALQYQLNNVNLWVNGVKTNTDTSAAMPVGLEKFTFTRGDSGNNFNGKVRNVQVFTEALTDEQLEKLTS